MRHSVLCIKAVAHLTFAAYITVYIALCSNCSKQLGIKHHRQLNPDGCRMGGTPRFRCGTGHYPSPQSFFRCLMVKGHIFVDIFKACQTCQ